MFYIEGVSMGGFFGDGVHDIGLLNMNEKL